MKRIFSSLFLLGLIVLSCTESDDSSDTTGTTNDNFDRQAMLVYWADQLIVPGYTELSQEAQDLDDALVAFQNSVNQTTLDNLRAAYVNANLAFQNVAMYNIGPAESLDLRARLNTYPVDVTQLMANLSAGNANLALPSNRDTQGFPALDYLLYAGDDSQVLARFSTDTDATLAMDYLQQVVPAISDLCDDVLDEWTTNYRDAFVAATSSSATGSVDQLVNDFMFYYEKNLRAGKVGIPAGVFSSQPLPDTVESLYEANGKRYLLESLDAVQGFFNGNGTNSLAGYLDTLNAQKNGADLSQLINDQFDTARTQITSLQADLSNQVSTDNMSMLMAYDELQRNVVLMKVDMFSALSINVDFVDADGD